MKWLRTHWENFNESERRFVIVLLLLAIAARLVYALNVDLIPPDKNGIDMDAVEYDHLGWSLSQGHGMVDAFGYPTSYRFPAYVYLLGLVYFLFGHHHLAALIVQALLGSLTPLLIYFTARQILHEKTSRLAGILAAFYPVFIYYVGYLMTENLFLFLLNLLIFLTVSLGRDAGWKKLAFMGIVIGLLSLTRGVGLPFIGLIPLYVFLRLKGDFRRKLGRAALVFGVAVLALLPWTARNYFVFHRIMLPSSEGGGVLWLAFNQVSFKDYYNDQPAYDYVCRVGRENASSEEFYRLLSENNLFGLTGMQKLFSIYYPDEPLPQSEPEATERLGAKAMVLLKQHPQVWVIKSITQVFRFWHVLDERGRYVYGYAFILPFFAAGFWLLRRRISELMPLYFFPLVLYGVAILFFADARFRMPFEGVFIIVAAFAIERFVHVFRRVYWGYGILVAFFLFNYYLRLHSPQVRLALRSIASALGLQLSDME